MSRSSSKREVVRGTPKTKRLESSESKNNERLIEIKNMDYTLLVSVILLVLIGVIMVFSSSYYNASNTYGRYHFFTSQAIAAAIGFVAMIFVSNINYRYLKQFSKLLYIISIFLLVWVLLFGIERGGATRWMEIPVVGVTFQPSELAKVSIIFMVSKLIATKKNILHTLKGTVYVSSYIILCVILVGLENLSTAIIITVIGFGIVFVASPYTAVFVALGTAAVSSLVIFLVFFAEGFRSARVAAWLDPFAYQLTTGFQTIQSLYAIASGGLFGLGLGQSRQKLGFIPEAHNDIIFSVIAEEMGLIGTGLVLFLFGVFLWRGMKIAMNAPDIFGSLVATGITIMIGSQVIINIAVVTNSIPNTGVPLPFISYGGTSMAIMLTAVGVLLSISRYSKHT